MSGYTPGPWRNELPYVKTGRASRYVFFDTGEHEYDLEDVATVKLIAASPILFEFVRARARSETQRLKRYCGMRDWEVRHEHQGMRSIRRFR